MLYPQLTAELRRIPELLEELSTKLLHASKPPVDLRVVLIRLDSIVDATALPLIKGAL